MALVPLFNDDTGLQARQKLNSAFLQVDENAGFLADADLGSADLRTLLLRLLDSGGIVRDDLIAGTPTFATKAAAAAASIPAAATSLNILGGTKALDGRGLRYLKVDAQPVHKGRFQTADGAWWELADIERGITLRALSDDDDEAFDILSDIAKKYAGWRSGYMVTPTTVDLGGRTWTLTAPVWIEAGVRLTNGRVVFEESALQGAYGLRLGLEGSSGTAYKQVLENVEFVAGPLDANCPAALVEIPRCFGGRFVNVMCHAGDGEFRTRYGMFVGGNKGWQISVEGGRYMGGECPLRIGRDSDHTGLRIHPEIIEHGRVRNLIVCNPRGCDIQGRMENWDGLGNIAITSATNGGLNIGADVTIHDGYMFRAVGDWDIDNTNILIGHNIPGTEGWDKTGVITSSACRMVTIRSNYMVANSTPVQVKANVTTGLVLDGNEWYGRGRIDVSGVSGAFSVGQTITGGTSGATASIADISGGTLYLDAVGKLCFVSGETITSSGGATGTAVTTNYIKDRQAVLSGTLAETFIRRSRNQNTGTNRPSFSSSGANLVGVDLAPADYDPVLKGTSTPGTVTYSARGGSWSVTNSVLDLTAYTNWTAVSGATGNLGLSIPAFLSDRARRRSPAALHTHGFSGAMQGLWVTGDYVTIYPANSSTPLTTMPASGQLHVTISIPLDWAD